MEMNKEVLGAKLKQVQEHIHHWSSSYERRDHNYEPIAVESIIGKLDGVVDIIDCYLSQLHDYDNHNKTNFNR